MNLLKEARFRLGSASHAHELHKEIASLRRERDAVVRELYDLKARQADAGSITWILSAGRTGSSWLAAMMEEAFDLTLWFEPRIGDFFDRQWISNQGGKGFVFHRDHEDEWLPAIRSFILEAVTHRFPGSESFVIKETSGSMNASLLLKALPGSKVALLPRDPRDVVASWQDAYSEKGWRARQVRKGGGANPLEKLGAEQHVRKRAENYALMMQPALDAYEAHPGPKFRVSYEELVNDASDGLHRMATALDFPNDQVDEVARKHSFATVPEKKRGPGQFYRRGKAGTYADDLTPEQVAIVEEVAGPIMERLGYGVEHRTE